MTTKINGAAYPGVWVEKQVTFIKITFSSDISTIAATGGSVVLNGTTTAVNGTTATADSTFGIVESVLVQALKTLETQATVLAVSTYNTSTHSVDVMVGFSDGFFATTNAGLITATASTGYSVPVAGAINTVNATIKAVGDSTNVVLGQLVNVTTTAAITYGFEFVTMDGSMPAATVANGALEAITDGTTPGSAANPMGASGWYPVNPYTA